MSDWKKSPFRRRVASQLGIELEALDRGLAQLEAREQADENYQAFSHNDRLKAFAGILDVPLTRLAGVDGVSSILPDRRPQPKRSKRPPTAKKTTKRAVSSKKSGTKRRRPRPSTVPMKKFPWELDPPPRPARTERERPKAPECASCGSPFHPLTGACGCT